MGNIGNLFTEKHFSSFLDKVEFSLTSNCWIWKGANDGKGYGKFFLNGKHMRVHRIAYELLKDKIPIGLELDHLCKNRSCINPNHLEIVTHRENLLRGNTFQASNSKKTHCPRGHEFSNRDSRGRRICKICSKERRSLKWA